MKKLIIVSILISIFVVAVVAGCGGIEQMYIPPRDSTPGGSTPRYIIANDEFAILHNERIYYSYSSGFFSMNADGSDHQMLNDVFARHIHIANDKFYFENDSYRGYIFSMSIDGTDLQQLNEDSVWGISVIDDWIYYNISRSSENRYGDDGMGIYKMRTDGSERQLLTDDEVDHFNVEGGIIYYEALDEYLSISIDGENRQQENCDWTSPSHTKRLRYFFDEDDGKIYCMRNDGGDRRQLSDDEWITLFGGLTTGGYETYYIFVFKTEA